MYLLLQTTQPASGVFSELLEALLGLAVVVITYKIIPAIRAWAEKSSADAQKAAVETNGRLSEQLFAFMLEKAIVNVERKFPEMAKRVLDGSLNYEGIKSELYRMGQTLRADAIARFEKLGVDVLDKFGSDNLDDMVHRAALMASPFDGKTTDSLLNADVAKVLVEKGIAGFRTPPAAEAKGTPS